jgi:hypothetical protein
MTHFSFERYRYYPENNYVNIGGSKLISILCKLSENPQEGAAKNVDSEDASLKKVVKKTSKRHPKNVFFLKGLS